MLPESEFELFKAGEQYLNYFEESYCFAGEPCGFKILFDGIWFLVFVNTVSWTDAMVTYVTATSGEIPTITTTVTETVTEKETIAETITATEKTMSEFLTPILLFSTLAALVGVFKRRRK